MLDIAKLNIASFKVLNLVAVMMKAINLFLLLIFLFSFTEQTTARLCPNLVVPDNTSSTGCSCYSGVGTVAAVAALAATLFRP